MTIRTMAAACIMAAGALLLAPCAAAQACPDTELAAAVQRSEAVGKPGVDTSKLAEETKASDAACATDPYVLKANTLTWRALALSTADMGRALEHADAAWRDLLRVEAQTVPSITPARQVMIEGKRRQVDFGNAMDVSKRVVELLLTTEVRSGRIAPSNPPPGPGVALPPCKYGVTDHARYARDFLDQTDSQGALNLLDRSVEACEAAVWQGRFTRIYRAQGRAIWASRNPSAPGALEKMLEAARDVSSISYIDREIPLDWTNDAIGAFNKAMFTVASANDYMLPIDRWFTPDNLNRSWTNAAMGVAFDRAWAKGQATGGGVAERLTPYRDLYVEAYRAANSVAESERTAAKTALYWSARRHAEGTFRGKGNEALPPPPDFLWKSLFDPTKR